ncbi:ATP-binding protein [Clostridium sp. 'White wine YQ']|uniref:ATP-binding protein n=1 Tax=Clostridium sp. 'White wine YQ' TaxID=3027474 RepID=UPI0023663E7A|nr:ATP-binding protein [Clostridium sp. 'White wine YQ']MDD7795438.1 ATP-binding protein [Clostridium sp. 'White wine YQ']
MKNNYRMLFESLSIYRGLLEDSVVKKLYKLVCNYKREDTDFIDCISMYNEFYHELMEKNHGNSLKEYIIKSILFSESTFGRMAQETDFKDIHKQILEAATKDLNNLEKIAEFSHLDIKEKFNEEEYEYSSWDNNSYDKNEIIHKELVKRFLDCNNWGSLIKEVADFHRENGVGVFSRFKGFIWEENELQGVVSLDPIRIDNLIKYDRERKIVIDNTIAFIKGLPANNILLYGSRGTGKSSTVKALLNEYYSLGLRIIEIPKPYLHTFPKLIKKLKKLPQKFILFIDDLAFEDSEETYTALKAVLEGGLESKPENVIIYATSNRRHLIKEKFSDRVGMSHGGDDEVHAVDSMEEKLSLADRFGITVTFISPNQKEYLEIVEEMVKERKILIPEDELRIKAIQWEMSYNGRSPRTAKQFVDWLEGKNVDK